MWRSHAARQWSRFLWCYTYLMRLPRWNLDMFFWFWCQVPFCLMRQTTGLVWPSVCQLLMCPLWTWPSLLRRLMVWAGQGGGSIHENCIIGRHDGKILKQEIFLWMTIMPCIFLVIEEFWYTVCTRMCDLMLSRCKSDSGKVLIFFFVNCSAVLQGHLHWGDWCFVEEGHWDLHDALAW